MKNFGQKKSCTCLQKIWFCSHFLQTEVRGKFHSLWVKICWSWNSNNRNIVAGLAEFIAGDWITWWRFKFRLHAKKILSKFIFKSFEKFRKYFHFPKSKNLKIFDFVFWKSEISKSEISKSEKYFLKMENIPKVKIKKFQIFRFWKMKIFSKFFQIF